MHHLLSSTVFPSCIYILFAGLRVPACGMKWREAVIFSLPMEDICVHITVQHVIAPVNVIQKPIQRMSLQYSKVKEIKAVSL